jgi:hypothetical protein
MSGDQGLDDLFADFEQAAKPAKAEAARPAPSPPRRGPGSHRGHDRGYRSALDEQQTDRRQMAKATGKTATVAGQYVRRSFTYRPDQLASIETLAEQLGLSQNDLVRWFTDMGIEAIERGKNPPLMEVVRKKYDPHLGGR